MRPFLAAIALLGLALAWAPWPVSAQDARLGAAEAAEEQAAATEAEDAAAIADGVLDADGRYRFSPGDVISIQVLEDSSLDRQLLVGPDGRISMPLAGILNVGDRTPEEVQDRVRAALARDFVQAPTVTVSLISTAALRRQADVEAPETFYILGQVARPGRFPVTESLDIVQALAIAGGPGPFAATSRIQHRRRLADGQEQVNLFDYEALEDGETLPQLVEIAAGDVIFVPERGLFE